MYRELGEQQENALISSARQCLQHSKPHAPFPSFLDRGQLAILSSSGSGSDVGDQHLPSPMAYGTRVLHESGYLPNKTHSNTAAGDIGTEKGGKFPTTACTLALVTHLVI